MSKHSWIVPVVTLVVAAALVFGIAGFWNHWVGSSGPQETDDACVRADITPLSTRVTGRVRKISVNDYDSVKAGQLLVEIDDEDFRATLGEAEAALAGARADFENNQSAKRIQDARILSAETSVLQAKAAREAAKAAVDSTQADVDRTAKELRREQSLFSEKAATRQQLEAATADADRFAALLAARLSDLQRADVAVESAKTALEAEKRQRSALDTRDASFLAAIRAREAAITVANVNLAYTQILAPNTGAVGQRKVQEGQLVTPGRQVFDLVDGDVWIQANFKETQLTNIRRGDSAEIRIDTFPGVVLRGKVAEIAPASGSQFALLPPDNATGNFTKVVQRVPVKIVLDPAHPLRDKLRPGFSAVVTVHASGNHSSNSGATS